VNDIKSSLVSKEDETRSKPGENSKNEDINSSNSEIEDGKNIL
jgi:hypothetical protein